MISYKRDVFERQSLSEVKMGRGSPICERVCKKMVKYFKNNIPQCQIAKALQISSSTVHNIIKRFRETVEISVRKGQGQRPSSVLSAFSSKSSISDGMGVHKCIRYGLLACFGRN